MAINNSDDKLYVYSVTKEEVLSCNLTGVKNFIFQLNKLKEKAYQNAMITIDGYDFIPDELFEIKEVRKFVQKMVNKFPHIFYFINRQVEAHVYILACLTDVESFYEGKKVTAWEGLLTNQPQTRIQLKIKLPDEWYNRLVSGTKKFNDIVNDNRGIRETLEVIEYCR